MSGTTRVVATDKLRLAVRDARGRGLPQFRLAQLAGFVSPSTLSHIIGCHISVRSDDERVRRLANILDVKFDEAFEPWRPLAVDEVKRVVHVWHDSARNVQVSRV